ncbi:Gfo/Idh/MocA family oxidoreductase [Lacunimicrobium album]
MSNAPSSSNPAPSSSNGRRDFLKTTAVAAAGTSLLNGFANSSFAANSYTKGDDTIRIGLVGCGGRGTGAAAQALKTTGKVELVAIGDVFEDSLDGSLKQIQRSIAGKDTSTVTVTKESMYSGFDAYKKVIDHPGVDLVILATPPGFRPMHYEYAVNAGKHIFCEKPVATDAAGVRKFMEAARVSKEKNLKIGIGLQRHHELGYLDLMQRILDGQIGDIVASHVYWNNNGVWEPRKTREQCKSEMEYQLRNWYYYTWACGDHIVEQHIHNLDVGCWLKGEKYPVEAVGMGGRQVRTDARYGEIYDHHAVEYTFDDGSKMFSQCRHIPNCWNSVSEYAIGTKGRASVSGAHSLETYAGEKYRADRNLKNDPYQTEHDVLFAAIREGKDHNESDRGAWSTMTSILGRLATYSGVLVKMKDALASEITIMPQEFAWDAKMPTNPGADGHYPIAVPGVFKPY